MSNDITFKKDPKKHIEQRNQSIRKMFRTNQKQEKIILNGCQLKYDTAFGINSNPISNQVQIVGQKYAIFIIGNIIVIRDLLEKNQKFITQQNRFNYVTAIFAFYKQKYKQSPNGPIMLFLGQSSQNEDKNANIILYKAYNQKLKIMNTGIKGIIKQIAFNRDKKIVVALMQSAQHLYISLWNYKKERLITNTLIKPQIQKISIHPLKPKSILLMGKNYLRLWDLQSQQNILKQSHDQLISLKTQKQNRFYDMAWLMTSKVCTLLILIGGNKILVLQNDNLAHTINLEQKQELFSIASTKKGFVVGGNAKCLSVYQLDKNFNINNTLSVINKNQIYSNEEKIIKIHVSNNDGIMTLATNNQVGAFNFYILNSLRLDAEVSAIQPFFPSGFHNKKINQLSISITKQLLASCSEDNTVKIWNFFDNEGNEKRGILSSTFNQQPLSISLHPSGLFVAIGFSSGFKIFAIVNDTLVILKQAQIPHCRFIRYSHGGHFLLVNQKQHIFVYDSIYYETLHLFSLTSNVKQVTITNDDLYIVATCSTGYVFCFSLYQSTKVKETYQNKKGFQHKQSTIYNCIGYDNKIMYNSDKTSQADLFIGCTIQKYMCLYKNKCKQLIAQFPIVDCHVTALTISKTLGVIFLGTNKGTIRICLWPLDQSNLQWEMSGTNQIKFKPPEFHEVNAHSNSITAIQISHDESFLFTGSEDGTIICFKIEQKSQSQKKEKFSLIKAEDRKRIAQSANDLYLQKIQKIEQKNEIIKKLKFQVVRSQQKLKLQKQKLDIMFKQKFEALKKQFSITLQTDKKIKQSYIENSEKQYLQLNKRLQIQKQKYTKQIQKVKETHKSKIQYEENRNKQLEEQIQNLHKKHKKDLINLKQEHQKEVKNNRREFFDKCQKLQIKYSNFIDKSKKNSKQFIEKLDKKQKQYQFQLQSEIKQKKQQINKIRTINQELQEKNKILTAQYNKLKQQDQKQQNHFQQLFKIHNNIRFENLKNDQDILKMQHQLLQRLQVIDSKEQTCKNARYEQTTLQNFRYMLDSKIQSLQQKKKQMMQKIAARQNDLKNMFSELIKQSEQNERKYNELKNLNGQIQVLENQIKKSQNQIIKNNNKLKNFQNQLSNIIKSDDDVKIVSRKLNNLIQECKQQQKQFVGNSKNIQQLKKNNKISQNANQEVYEELSRQAKWMNKKLNLIKSTAQNYKQIRQDNINQILNQNTKLIQQCNNLRKSNEGFKRDIKRYQKQLAQYLRKKEKLQNKKKLEAVNLNGLNKKLQQNQNKLTHQQNKLESINEQMKEILKKRNALPTTIERYRLNQLNQQQKNDIS